MMITFIILFFNLLISLLLLFLFYTGRLADYIGYTDWVLYSKILIGDVQPSNFFEYSLSFFSFFGNGATYIWHSLFTSTSILGLTIVQIDFLRKKQPFFFLITFNPMVYLLLIGVFKESLIFSLIFIFSRYVKNNIFRYVFPFLLLLIRPHLVYIFNFLIFRNWYFILSMIFSSLIIFNLGYINYDFIESSKNEITGLGLRDLPVYDVTASNWFYIAPINTLIILSSWYFSSSSLIFYSGLIQTIFLILGLVKVGFGSLISIASFIFLYLFFYSFFLISSGTAYRIVSLAILYALVFNLGSNAIRR